MAKNVFPDEPIIDYRPKRLCVFVLDVSGSMNGEPIKELNEGIHMFISKIKDDVYASEKNEISIIAFNDLVETIQEPALVYDVSVPMLTASGSTAMVTAMKEAIEKVAARKQWYKETNRAYYRPWIILMTDGEPDSDQDIVGLAQRIKQDVAAKKYSFLPIGVEGANMNILKQIEGSIPAIQLQSIEISDFFKRICIEVCDCH